jgi:hypothetical protein
MKTKSEQIKDAIATNDYTTAFRIAKSFFNGLTKDQKRSIDIAHECESGKKSFYVSVGVDVDSEKQKAISILKAKFA